MKPLLMQGDVALRECSPIEGKGVSVKNGVIAEGEHTGHAHVVRGDATLETINGKMYVRTGDAASSVDHLKNLVAPADHAPITLKPNTMYEVILQNEFNPYEKSLQRVVD